jgi:PadR family transcriptional regulator PadR
VSRRRARSIRRWTASKKKGLVASTYGDPTPERGGRAKRYFTVTARGVHAVACAQRAFQRLMKGLVLPGGAGA